ncbi:MAG: glycosyltransferase [Chloroflexi bacterium]|nr:MAG: glycosyltransferase [Chloroflexota bacterium]MBL1194925.1 glycosyltransferase [Chloroflexota bacterium]
MRILIAGTTYYPAINGQAIFTANLAEGMARRGHQVFVATQYDPKQPGNSTHNRVEIYRAPAISLERLYAEAYVSLFPKAFLRELFEEIKPEVVHIQDHSPIGLACLSLAEKNNIPAVFTSHFVPKNYTAQVKWLDRLGFISEPVLWLWAWLAYRRVKYATAQSDYAVRMLREHGVRGHICKVSCGIDVEHFSVLDGFNKKLWQQKYDVDTGARLLLFLGRVDRDKNLGVLIEAIQKVKADGVVNESFQLLVAGKGNALEDMQQLAKNLELDNEVRFLGYVPIEDLPELYHLADLFIMPSEVELLSISTVQAMASCLPVLAARRGALPELVTEGGNGDLFDGQDVNDVARAISEVLAKPEAWSQMGEESRERAQVHSMEAAMDGYEQIYRRLANGQKSC